MANSVQSYGMWIRNCWRHSICKRESYNHDT